MRGMILAAGFGSRLGTLSDERPKPLLPICDIPVIRFAVALLRGHGIHEQVVNLHHLGELIEAELGSGQSEGVTIDYSRESRILGTGGGMKHALAQGLLRRDEPFIAMNGKIVFDLDLDAVLARHRESGALATLVVRADPEARRWGAIGVRDGLVASILPKTDQPGVSEHMFTGVQVIEPALLERLPDGEACILRNGYIPALAAGERLAAYVAPGYFQEHSTPARYLEGNFKVLRGEAKLQHRPRQFDRDVLFDFSRADVTWPVSFGMNCVLEPGSAVGPDVVVGRGARVLAGARLTRTVVWPGATASGQLDGAIVTPRTIVRV